MSLPLSISWTAGKLTLLDQRTLPAEECYLTCETHEQVYDAIRSLAVRGAPAIGIAGAYGCTLGLDPDASLEACLAEFRRQADYLESARPTAVNLSWAIARLRKRAIGVESSPELVAGLEAEAIAIHEEDRQLCQAIGEHGQALVQAHSRILTHCNAGSLAVSELGTALAPIHLAHQRGLPVQVWVDETRPLLQGARLTAFEMNRAGIPHQVITDNMAASVMAAGNVDMVLVGADRVAANGDAANKIGTLGLAVLARYFDIPFYVACPGSTVDLATDTGADIKIEERDPEEVAQIGGVQLIPEGSPVFNPAFDVTPHALITGILTEQGLLSAPFRDSLKAAHGA